MLKSIFKAKNNVFGFFVVYCDSIEGAEPTKSVKAALFLQERS